MNTLTKESKEKVEKCPNETKCTSSLNLLFEDSYYIGPPSEYNENGIDTRTGEPFYKIRVD